jgi:hypothetical protein
MYIIPIESPKRVRKAIVVADFMEMGYELVVLNRLTMGSSLP